MKTSFKIHSRLLAVAAIVGCLGSFAGLAQAATATASMTVSTSIPVTCSVGNVVNVTIPSPPTLAVAQDITANGSVDVTCTNAGSYSVDVGNGSNYTTTRRMKKPTASAFLTYGLFTNTGRTVAFPLTSQVGTGSAQTIPIYAKLDAQTATESGSYTDSVTITVTY